MSYGSEVLVFFPSIEMALLRLPCVTFADAPTLVMPSEGVASTFGIRRISIEPETSPGAIAHRGRGDAFEFEPVPVADYVLTALFLEDALDALKAAGHVFGRREHRALVHSWAAQQSSIDWFDELGPELPAYGLVRGPIPREAGAGA